jgi:hypothetical protein
MAVSDFADLARDPEPVIVGGQFWSPANLVAAVVNGLLDLVEPDVGAVSTYPAIYSGKQVALLRQALDLSGARDVLLVPEPVAAAEWLEQEHGPLKPGFVLVYDLGGTCLDVAVVRVGPDWDDHPVVGKPMRSYDFGGRPLGSMIARYAGSAAPGRSTPLSMMSIVDIDGLRTEHIRDSFDVVRACIGSSGLTLSDIGRILLVGGASRPTEVARTLAELGRPVVMSADPGQSVATGAACYAARTFAPAGSSGKHLVHPTVFSGAAVASAIAMSAATVLGGPVDPGLTPALERAPGVDIPAGALLYEPGGDVLIDPDSAVWRQDGWTTESASFTPSGRPVSGLQIAPAAHTTTFGPTMAESRLGSHQDPRSCCNSGQSGTYANPAHFINPLPFAPSRLSFAPAPNLPFQLPAVPNQPVGTPAIPSISLPANFPGATPAPAQADPNPAAPAAPGTATTPAAGTETSTTSGSTTSATGGSTTSGATDTPASGGASGSTSGETASGGTTSSGSSPDGSAGGGAPSGGASSSGASSGGSTSGGSGASTGETTSGGASSGVASSGGDSSRASSGGASAGGASSGASSGGTSSGGASSGGVSSGGVSSGGVSSGGMSSGGVSSGGASSGGASSSGGVSSGGASSGGASSGHLGGGSGGGFGGSRGH